MLSQMTGRSRTTAIVGAAVLGAALIAGPASAADSGSDGPTDDASVDVSVTIEDSAQPGALTLSVEKESTILEESGSTNQYRQFTGYMAQVLVTDTRKAEDLPDGARWSVVGQASSLGSIPARNLGWAPFNGNDPEEGLFPATPGGAVQPGYPNVDEDEDVVGLSWPRDLLHATDAKRAVGATWGASARLILRTPVDQKAGTYTGTITLSLFE